MIEVTTIGTAVTQAVKISSAITSAPQLTQRASSRTGCKKTILYSLRTISGPTHDIWTRWTIMSGAPCWKRTINWAKAQHDWWVESRFADRLGSAATRTHQQGGDKLHQVLDCLHGCQWWSLWASSVRAHFQVCILSTRKPSLFRAIHIMPKCTKVVTNFFQGSAATLSRWGGQINSFCVAYYLNILCAKYCRNQLTCVDNTVKWTEGYFCVLCIWFLLNSINFLFFMWTLLFKMNIVDLVKSNVCTKGSKFISAECLHSIAC